MLCSLENIGDRGEAPRLSGRVSVFRTIEQSEIEGKTDTTSGLFFAEFRPAA